MRVALGTIEIDDDTRKAIRKLAGGKGDATRQEVKDYLLTALANEVIPYIGEEPEEDEPQPLAAVDGDSSDHAQQPVGPSTEELPEPTTRAFP